MVYGDFKDLNRRTTSDKILHYKVFNTAKYDEYQRGITSTIYQFFDKKNENISNKELADELHKPIIRKLKKEKKVYSPFAENILGAYLADMQSISNLIKEFVFYYVLLI